MINFTRLLQPMSNCVFKQLIPNHRAVTNRVNATTGCAQIRVNFHPIDQQMNCFRLEIDITVESEEVSILRDNHFSFRRSIQLHYAVS